MEKSTKDILIGQTEENAISLLKESGLTYRIARRDKENFMLTADFKPMRFNLSIDNKVVTDVKMG